MIFIYAGRSSAACLRCYSSGFSQSNWTNDEGFWYLFELMSQQGYLRAMGELTNTRRDLFLSLFLYKLGKYDWMI